MRRKMKTIGGRRRRGKKGWLRNGIRRDGIKLARAYEIVAIQLSLLPPQHVRTLKVLGKMPRTLCPLGGNPCDETG